MSWIKIHKETPDGLDPVFDAYECLKRIFEAAEPLVCDCEAEEEEFARYGCPHELMVRLPGSGELVDTNDLNPLYALEYWLAEQVTKDVEVDSET